MASFKSFKSVYRRIRRAVFMRFYVRAMIWRYSQPVVPLTLSLVLLLTGQFATIVLLVALLVR